MSAILEARNLSKKFHTPHGPVTALDGVSLQVEQGDFTLIMGPSGSGKSTLISLLGGLDRPTRGNVLLRGRDLNDLSSSELLRVRRFELGYVFQDYYLMQHLTALENVLLPLGFRDDLNESEREAIAQRRLDEVEVGHRAEHYPRQLSGGERQRVAIARALANQPHLLLADEPTGNLDVETTETVLNLFARLNENGQTIIIVTHDPLARDYTESVLHLAKGKLLPQN